MLSSPTSIYLKHLAYIPMFLIGLSMESYFILLAFMVVDVFTGVVRSGVVKGWQSVKSRIFSAGIIAKLTLLIVPLLVAWAGRGVGIDLLFLAKGSLGMLVLSEGYSILGNIHSINIRKDVPEFDAISFVLKSLRKSFEALIKGGEKK